ncbi:zinc dependent phospholipase C family protein [[Clostridium] fimetarium]|uniref:Zinc dependent phospholipase C n=1 Tax=[Clostridium] fimetarium TaxID=99656 RepID=A0A1I0RUG7_9FIRM|nr:zinc dependent phospholipase C family protein [[Clostridium] fimetarium]SEW45102.1 Zinc dependent phospholipase C [[Clostridium] fimetarium]
MPSLATHFLFGQDVFKKVDISTKHTIKKGLGAFRLGLQGPDIFFYDLLHSVIAHDKNIGSKMHTQRTDIFFYHYVDYLKDNGLDNDEIATSYLYGMLCHYSLDCASHPFVYYFTNLHDKSPEGKNKSLSIHCQFESNIDELLYMDRNGKNICDIKRSKFMEISQKEIDVISPIIAHAISETYKCDITANYVRGSIKRGLKINSLLNNKYGVKKPLIGLIEKPIMGSHIGTSLMFTRKLPSRACLNENHEEWHIPFNNTEMYSSFMDLYNLGMTDAIRFIHMAMDVLDKKCSISKFSNSTGGMSYHTGLNWRLGDEMVYFKSND